MTDQIDPSLARPAPIGGSQSQDVTMADASFGLDQPTFDEV